MKNRRDFIKQLMAIGVLSAACPHDLISVVQPTTIKDTGNKIAGIYKLDLLVKDKDGNLKYPDLQKMWGSVFLEPIVAIDGSFQFLEVNRIDETLYGKPYAVMNRSCPHMGEMVELLNPDMKVIRCPRHGSLFNPDGSLYYSQTTNLSLERYDCSFDGDHSLYVELNFYVSAADSGESTKEFSIERLFPNPCRGNLLIDFNATKPTTVEFSVFDLLGNKVLSLGRHYVAQGKQSLQADLSGLGNGNYFIRMTSDNGANSMLKFMLVK